MSAIFIEKIRTILTKPMIDKTPREELLEILIIIAVLSGIWLIGELVYKWEIRHEIQISRHGRKTIRGKRSPRGRGTWCDKQKNK